MPMSPAAPALIVRLIAGSLPRRRSPWPCRDWLPPSVVIVTCALDLAALAGPALAARSARLWKIVLLSCCWLAAEPEPAVWLDPQPDSASAAATATPARSLNLLMFVALQGTMGERLVPHAPAPPRRG